MGTRRAKTPDTAGSSGASHLPDDSARPHSDDPVVPSASAHTEGDAEGSDRGDQQADERQGVDSRQRGWFWHWNGIVTQYAPLIGLKGVGLLNSYTVWTDRREESPHRGYAFPSQQAEADFYGEERAELITINKILVALGLIEIRKEMILRTDERGRRWRVPHNLYRVKDRPDGVTLRATDVRRVAILASEDEGVFRYVRRVFSSRFKPIDRDNVWHEILDDLANDPLWQQLQERTREIEERASARTRAGHRRRASHNISAGEQAEPPSSSDGELALPDKKHVPTPETGLSTFVDASNNEYSARTTSVASTNDGSTSDVDAGNSGSDDSSPANGAPFNNGHASSVAATNTTYHQEISTTKTTTAANRLVGQGHGRNGSVPPTTGGDVGLGRFVAGAAEHTGVASGAESLRGSSSEWTDSQVGEAVDGDDSQVVIEPTERATGRSADRRSEHRGNDSCDTNGRQERQRYSGEAGERETGFENAVGHGTASNGGRESGWDEEDDEPVTSLAGTRESRRVRSIAPVVQTGPGGAEINAGDQRSAASRTDGERSVDRTAPATDRQGPGGAVGAAGPLVDPSPLVVSIFEAANNRGATPLERILLGELERDADPAARAAGSTGADWLAAAMREAVASGSTFVAPKRIREIVNRWASDGSGPGAAKSNTSTSVTAPPAPSVNQTPAPEQPADADPAAVRLPGGMRGASVWSTVLDDLSRTLDRGAFERLLAGSVITRYWRGTVEIRVASEGAVGKLSGEYRGLVERHLNARLKRPVAVSFHTAPDVESVAPAGTGGISEMTNSASSASQDERIIVSAADVELGRQLWHVILDEVAGDANADDLERLAPVVPLGQDSAGTMVLGVSSPVARRLIEGHYRRRIEQSLSGLLGRSITLRTVSDDGWSVVG